MALTTLIAENVIIGCLTWGWILLLLFRVGALDENHLHQLLTQWKDYAAAIGVLAIALIYAMGSIMNTACYMYASWLFAKRMNKSLGLDGKGFNDAYIYVLQHGSEPLVRQIHAMAIPSMRLSRAVFPSCLALSVILFSWGRGPAFPWAWLALSVAALALPTYYYTTKDWKEEIVTASRMLQKSGEDAA
jgi:hypothetical protein